MIRYAESTSVDQAYLLGDECGLKLNHDSTHDAVLQHQIGYVIELIPVWFRGSSFVDSGSGFNDAAAPVQYGGREPAT